MKILLTMFVMMTSVNSAYAATCTGACTSYGLVSSCPNAAGTGYTTATCDAPGTQYTTTNGSCGCTASQSCCGAGAQGQSVPVIGIKKRK